MEKNSKITQQTKVDIATFVHFFTLARNRLPPKPDVDDYVEELYESLSWFKFGDRPDFIFFYVLFDFHGMLPTRPVLTMVFSNWYKSYREAIARELGVSLQANPPAWQQLMAFMRKLPCVIKEAQEKICFYNVTKRIVKGEEERNERIHEEHFRLWAAMRYNVKHWQSLDSLRALLADLPPKSSTTGTFTKPVVPEEHKFCEMDFIPNCTGIGYNCFHLASFTSRRAAFQFYPKLTGTKRKMSNPPSALVTSKKIRLEPESIPPIVDDVPVNNEAGADDIGDTNVIGNDDTGADSDEIDLFTLSPSHQEMPGSPLYPPSPPTPYRGNFDTIPVFTFISNHPLAEPLVIERSVAQRPSITPSLGLRILANIDTDYRTNSRGQTFLHLRASDCIVRLSEFDKVDSDDMFCYREVTLTRVTLAQTGGSMTRLAVIFFERLMVLHFEDVEPDLVAKLQPVLYNSLRALSIKSISKPLIAYGLPTQYAKLQFFRVRARLA